jgi:hypothetical protein
VPLSPEIRTVAAVEAAFATGDVIDGDQVSFARIRFFADVPETGTYTVTHPYGVEVFEVPAVGDGREIQFTRDIGIGGPGDFTGALKGDIGPFLVRAAGTITVGTETFIGDPNVLQTVSGSPFGTNLLRVQGPAGSGIDLETNLFTVAGKLFTTVILPTPLVVDRSTYNRNLLQAQIDVFALSPPTATVSFNDNAGSPWPANGDAAGKFFGQALDPVADIQGAITVNAANVGNTAVSVPANVTDVVSITRAEYSLATGILTIEASSSDEDPLPTLTAGPLGSLTPPVAGPIQTRTFTGLTIPPATVTVTSSRGGSDTEEVVVLP